MFYPAYLKLWRAKEEFEGLVDMWATKMLKGEDGVPGPGPSAQHQLFANGSSAFKRSQNGIASGVESWAANSRSSYVTNRAKTDAPLGNANNGSSAPLLSLGSAARQEMLLERLPYMSHIARRRRCTFGSMRIKDLEKIVSFKGIANGVAADTDDEGADEEGQVGEGDAWATDKPTENDSPKKKGRRSGQGLGAILSKGRSKAAQEDDEAFEMPIQGLVLSDDDIEDD
jgi:cell cycle checkpoint protein